MRKEIWSFIETEDGKLHYTAAKMASEARRDSKLFEGIPCGVFLGPPTSISLLADLKVYGLKKIYFVESIRSNTYTQYSWLFLGFFIYKISKRSKYSCYMDFA